MGIPKTQTGFGFTHGLHEINRFDSLPVKEPGPGEVLLKIELTGLCRSDHHILLAQNPMNPPKMVMGHEICGSVAKAGSSVASDPRYEVGTRYSLFISNPCGSCANCRTGRDNLCLTNPYNGYGITEDGGFQEYLLVRNLRNLVPIPDGVSYEAAASATDAVLTPFHAISKVKHLLSPTTKVLLLGAGGLGLNALQILKVYGCKVVCVDQKASNEKFAREFGASEFYTSFDDIEDGPESFDICFDFIGNQHSVDCCVEYTAGGGKIVIVGMGKLKVTIPNFDSSRREIEYIFNFGGYSSEQAEVLEWIKAGLLKPVVEVRPMDELPQFMEKLKKGQIVGRVAFRPKGKL